MSSIVICVVVTLVYSYVVFAELYIYRCALHVDYTTT